MEHGFLSYGLYSALSSSKYFNTSSHFFCQILSKTYPAHIISTYVYSWNVDNLKNSTPYALDLNLVEQIRIWHLEFGLLSDGV